MNTLTKILVRVHPIVVVVAGGYYGWIKIKANEKTVDTKSVQKKSRKRKVVTKVEKLTHQDYRITLHTQGSLTPANVTSLTPQVSGRVTFVNQSFQAGAFVKEGETLLKIDTADYDSAIITSEASLARAEASLAQEVARGEQALRNWKDIGFKEAPNDLVLRKPQLKEAKANVKSAEAGLARARRNKQRCEVKAPFSGLIRARLIGIGASVTANSRLGDLLATDYAEVRLPLTNKQIVQLDLSSDTSPQVIFRDALQPNNNRQWVGKIIRREGEMDLTSREIIVIAKISDPFNLKKTHQYPLSFNQPLLAAIPAKELKSVIAINRQYIKGLKEIIAVQDGRIKRLKLEPIWEDADSLIVDSNSLPQDLQLAISKLNYAAEGAKVQVLHREPKESSDPMKADK